VGGAGVPQTHPPPLWEGARLGAKASLDSVACVMNE
jgi:hypothetical protein